MNKLHKLKLLMNLWRAGMLAFGLVFCLLSTVAASNITAIWANDGGDKVTQDDLRATRGTNVVNSVWNGTMISLFGGRNEVVAFNLILEAGSQNTGNITVTFNNLSGPSGATIASIPATGNGVFSWVNRQIELFYVRYLQINGLSLVSYGTYDERQIPKRLERPWSGNGQGSGTWTDRPDHNKYYPEIAVPLELVPNFTISGGSNQSIWVDIYIPKTAPQGLYQGTLVVQEGGTLVQRIPVQLQVYNFTLPDTPNAKTMVYFSSTDINRRFLGSTYINPSSAQGTTAQQLRDRYFQLAHRHKISLIDDDADDCNNITDQPCPEWSPRLSGSLFSSVNGYDGPGVNTGNNVYAIGTYGTWDWQSGGENAMNQHADAWATWFSQNAPATEYFLYLDDESTNTVQTQTWAQWIINDPGPGQQMRSMATLALTTAAVQCPSLDIPTSTIWLGIPQQWQPLADQYSSDTRKRFYVYNGHRPASGSFATDDDGVSLRELAWVQYKKHVNRWYFWESTYYNNYQGNTGEGDLFHTAQTFGNNSTDDPVLGQTGWNYSNGDGVLFYPGTDVVYPADSYGVEGPLASLRLKEWRRGIQDVDYLTLAAAINPGAVQVLVSSMVPEALWEYGVTDPSDPTYVLTNISWSIDPNAWEAARAQLANIITGGVSGGLLAPTLNLPPFLPVNATIAAGYPGSNVSFQWTINAENSTSTINSSSPSKSPNGAPSASFQTPSSNADLATYALTPGYYSIMVQAVDAAGGISPPAQAYVTLVEPSPNSVRVFPNPWRSDKHSGSPITFTALMLNSTVKIFTVSGHLVKTLAAPEGTAMWDLTNDSGERVASGLYLYLITSDQGPKTTGRLVVIR